MVFKKCSVPSCGCNSDGSGGFFSLPNFSTPKSRKKRKEWSDALGLSDYFMDEKITKQFFICFRHFTVQEINTSGKYLKLDKGMKLYTLESLSHFVALALCSFPKKKKMMHLVRMLTLKLM